MGKKKQKKIERLIRDLRKAKGEILKSIETPKKHRGPDESKSLSASYDKAALNIAMHRYGYIMDRAIKDLEATKKISKDVHESLKRYCSPKPDDSGLGPWRMQKFHNRFRKKGKPLLEKALKL